MKLRYDIGGSEMFSVKQCVVIPIRPYKGWRYALFNFTPGHRIMKIRRLKSKVNDLKIPYLQ